MEFYTLFLALFAFIGLLIAFPTSEPIEKRSLFIRTSDAVIPVANGEPPAAGCGSSSVPGSPSSQNSFRTTLNESDASNADTSQQPGTAIAPSNAPVVLPCQNSAVNAGQCLLNAGLM
jgi:hypothetical protein